MIEHDDLNESINTDGLTRECLQCGSEFIPDESGQECCGNECDARYYEWYNYEEWDVVEDDTEYYGGFRTGAGL